MLILMTGTMAMLHWKTPTSHELLLLCITGIFSGIGQLALFEGMRQAPVSVLAPFEYTSLVWAFALGYLIWGDVPGINTFLGAILILSAGLIIIFSERRRRVSVV
jgi:drug/metabolite transporter (DMT)-like permease